ncbi:MAG TPA: ABC transporter permease [Opitutaceae bacterium]|nr:ABC transporter permease [Opitutaceae bacterium]
MNASAPTPVDEPVSVKTADKGNSLWHDAWLRLRKNKLAVFGIAVIALVSIACFAGPFFIAYGYEEQNLDLRASPPMAKVVKIFDPTDATAPVSWSHVQRLREDHVFGNATESASILSRIENGETVTVENRAYKLTKERHVLGTDVLGRDLLVRLLYGGRVSLGVGMAATFVALTIGVIYGAIAGYQGGKLDSAMMRFVDIIYSLPFTIFVILLMVFFGRDIYLLFVAIGAVEWLTMARIVRGQVMSIKRTEYVEAARSLGLSNARIIFRHILPNVVGPVIVYTTLTIPNVMLLEAFLSFLGLGVQPPMSSWGWLIKEGAEKMEEFPWLLISPGVVFSVTLFSLNFLGDGLRDALDVRSSKD